MKTKEQMDIILAKIRAERIESYKRNLENNGVEAWVIEKLAEHHFGETKT